MSGRKVFTAGEVLQAADVNDFLMDQSVMVFAGTAARGSAIPSPTEGMVTYRSDDDLVEVFNGSSFVGIGGKVLQVVRATDATDRSTTSTTFVDASISVTITPEVATSAIILIWSLDVRMPSFDYIQFQITDSSNVAVSGAEEGRFGTSSDLVSSNISTILIGYSTPSTTSATTYKGRFKTAGGGSGTIFNTLQTGQLYAIEVGA